LGDIFEDSQLFDRFHSICRRLVAWNETAEVVSLPHSATVASEELLLDRLWQRIDPVPEDGDPANWTIVTSRGARALPEEYKCGSRFASVTTARLRSGVPEDCCWVEAVRDGWLFLLASGQGEALLISVGLEPQAMLQQSRLVREQVETIGAAISQFPAYPRILPQLYGPDWLACGSAAMSFDPVCGEGAGNAAREAILASAVLGAIAAGEDRDAVLAHYQSRLFGGFSRHLETCLEFYTRARQGPWWDGEIALLEGGIAWTRERMRMLPRPSYRLVDFRLERL
jgi:2-polyprenyl-6-methoxyphenol hydroxylase-like FAD-dependent oxidoreductase